MLSLPIIAAFLQAGLFKFHQLITKRLQDNGMQTLTVLYYQRLAIIPGAILLAASFRMEYVSFLLHHPLVLAAVAFSGSVWMLHMYLKMQVQEAVNSMTFLNAFSAIINLPVYLVVGMVLNHDTPNWYVGIALILLAIALAIRPAIHSDNRQKQTFRITFVAAVLLSLAGQVIDALNMGAYRYFLQNISAILFGLAFFTLLAMGIICIFFWIKKPTISHRNTIVQHGYWPFWLPALWIIGTLCEGYALFVIPIYTLLILAAFTFLLDIGSDVRHRRIQFNLRTSVFVLLVLSSTILSVISVG